MGWRSGLHRCGGMQARLRAGFTLRMLLPSPHACACHDFACRRRPAAQAAAQDGADCGRDLLLLHAGGAGQPAGGAERAWGAPARLPCLAPPRHRMAWKPLSDCGNFSSSISPAPPPLSLSLLPPSLTWWCWTSAARWWSRCPWCRCCAQRPSEPAAAGCVGGRPRPPRPAASGGALFFPLFSLFNYVRSFRYPTTQVAHRGRRPAAAAPRGGLPRARHGRAGGAGRRPVARPASDAAGARPATPAVCAAGGAGPAALPAAAAVQVRWRGEGGGGREGMGLRARASRCCAWKPRFLLPHQCGRPQVR